MMEFKLLRASDKLTARMVSTYRKCDRFRRSCCRSGCRRGFSRDFRNFSIRHDNPIDEVTRPIATSPVANALSRSTLQPVASKRNHRGSAGLRPAVFKDAGKDACATGTRQCFFNLPGLCYITTPRERALTALCRDLLRSYRFSMCSLPVWPHAHFRFQGHGQFGHGGHLLRQADPDDLQFVLRHFQHQFVMHLHDESRFQAARI